MFGKEEKPEVSPEIAGLEELIALLNEKIKGGLKSRKEKPAVEALAVEAEPEMEGDEGEVSAEDALAAIGGKDEEDEDELA